MTSWQSFAFASAFFAGLTAILGKIGVTGVNSNFATFIRTIVILLVIGGIISFRSEWQKPGEVATKSMVFLVLSGIATGLSWLCYYRALQMAPASKVAPIDKLSVAFAIGLALIFLKEPLTWQTLCGGLLVVAGSLVLAFA